MFICTHAHKHAYAYAFSRHHDREKHPGDPISILLKSHSSFEGTWFTL